MASSAILLDLNLNDLEGQNHICEILAPSLHQIGSCIEVFGMICLFEKNVKRCITCINSERPLTVVVIFYDCHL